MDHQTPEAVVPESVPTIIVTEPSPLVPNTVVSIAQKIAAVPEEKVKEIPLEGTTAITVEPAATGSEQVTAVPESESSSSGEFSPTEDCNGCVVAIPEVPESQSAEEIAPSETEQDDFRTQVPARCCPRDIDIYLRYDKLRDMLRSVYSLPFWVILFALPLSAGVVGALNMKNCPATESLATFIFMIGISLMAVITLRICSIIQGIACDNETAKIMLRVLLLISTFMTVVMFITESVTFWKNSSASQIFCNPQFEIFAFWWNCVTSGAVLLILIFPL